ncbi:alpha/beta hydrolase [Pontibacter sp. MBLB2868]|uniref:alpha/beta hydrolase n=1 Tax=Pontibacter sp. MBLB2868 TaxID=3451555 RepID=UPI003F74BF91
MKIYAISGLGADERVFNYLKLNCDLVPVKWIEHHNDETIEEYSNRLSKIMDTTSEFGILGVSFGGLIAVEISKIMKPKLTILLSTAETKDELRPLFRLIGKTGLLQLLPPKTFDPPRVLAQFLFGTPNKGLLNSILDDTNLDFAKWAVNQLTNWNNRDRIKNVLRIHGSNDKLIPFKGNEQIHLVQNGGHFMIVDRAEEISEIINKELKAHYGKILEQ